MTEEVIDLRYLAEFQPSLCIPRVFNNITEARIRHVFGELGLGNISRLDILERKNEKGDTFKRVYVHFDKWFWNEDAQAVRRKLVSGKEIKIVYDSPWFWKVSASKWKPLSNSQNRGASQRTRAHIDFDEEPRSRVTDEFGPDLTLKKEYEESCRLERRNDSRERRRPERRDDTRVRRRPDNRSSENRNDKKNAKLPIAPTLTCKPENREPVVHRSLSSSPPRQRIVNPDMVKIDYGDAIPPPLRKRKITAKNPAADLVVKQEPLQVQDGEVVEEQPIFSGCSEEKREICDELYREFM